jgi:hypothetical protein
MSIVHAASVVPLGVSVWVLRGDGGGERVGQLVDLFEEVGEDALGFLASAGGGELGGPRRCSSSWLTSSMSAYGLGPVTGGVS